MGLSNSTSTSTSGPSPQALPYLTAGSGALQNAYNANQPNTQAIGQTMLNSFNNYNNSINNNPTMDAAKGYVQNTLGQPYTQSPGLQGIMADTNNNVQNAVNAEFSNAGQTGSSRQIGELGRQISTADNTLGYNDYQTWLQRQQAAAGLAPGLQSADNQSALGLSTLGGAAASEPYLGAQILSQGLGSLWGNSQTTTQTQSPSLLGGLLGTAGQIGAAAIMHSDRRLKDDVTHVRTTPDGLPVYAYRYKGGSERHIGVMADDVARVRPWALGPVVDGFGSVDYAKLGAF